MSAVLGFFFLVSLIASCYSRPLEEFDTDLNVIEKELANLKCPSTSNCQNATEPKCKCICSPDKMKNCNNYECIKHGLAELNFVCNYSKETHRICNLLERLRINSENTKDLCEKPVARDKLLEKINYIRQLNNSQM